MQGRQVRHHHHHCRVLQRVLDSEKFARGLHSTSIQKAQPVVIYSTGGARSLPSTALPTAPRLGWTYPSLPTQVC